MENLLYKEDDKLRTFFQEGFTYIYDKDTMTSFSWGKTKDDDPMFNPIGPEIVNIVLDDDYVFDSAKMKGLLSLPTENSSDFITVCRCANIMPGVELNEAIKLAEWLEDNFIFASIVLDYGSYADLRSIVRLKMLNLKKVLLSIKNHEGLADSVKNFIDNGIYVSLEFDNPSDVKGCLSELEKLPEAMPATFKLSNKEDAETVTTFKVDNILRPVRILNDSLSMIGKLKGVVSFEPGLFSCVIDFKDGTVYPSDKKTALSLDSIKHMSEYWLSKMFCSFRKRAIRRIESSLKEDNNNKETGETVDNGAHE